MVFANYQSTLNIIKDKLTEKKIGKDILGGSAAKINSTLKKFKNGKLKVIILNALNFGSGLNIQEATDVIIYHRFDKELEEQVIGRAQRYGRTDTLDVHYLIHDNETTDFMDTSKFVFNDDEQIYEINNNNDLLEDIDSDSDSDSSSDSDSDSDSSSDSEYS
jgi:ERCC4-related helicase